MIKFHYGVTIDSKTPITGVIANNTATWIYEDFDNAVNLSYEDHCAECDGEVDGCHNACWESQPSDTLLIGFRFDEKIEKWEEDPSAEYSAIVGEVYTQVTKSKWILRCNLCSPCYPGQGNLDEPRSEGFLAYCLPPDLFDSTDLFPTKDIMRLCPMTEVPCSDFKEECTTAKTCWLKN